MSIKNDYTNQRDRESFQIEIVRCDDSNGNINNCHGDTPTTNLLEKVFFTFYNTEQNVEFGDPKNLGISPLRISDAFHS